MFNRYAKSLLFADVFPADIALIISGLIPEAKHFAKLRMLSKAHREQIDEIMSEPQNVFKIFCHLPPESRMKFLDWYRNTKAYRESDKLFSVLTTELIITTLQAPMRYICYALAVDNIKKLNGEMLRRVGQEYINNIMMDVNSKNIIINLTKVGFLLLRFNEAGRLRNILRNNLLMNCYVNFTYATFTPAPFTHLIEEQEFRKILNIYDLSNFIEKHHKINATFDLAKLPALNSINILHSDMSHINLNKAIIVRCNFNGSRLRNAACATAIFIESDLVKTDLSESKLQNTCFVNSVLKNVLMSGAVLCDSSFIDSNLDGADLSKADLQNAKLFGSRLHNIKIDGANLKGIQFFSNDITTGWDVNEATLLNILDSILNNIEPNSDNVVKSLSLAAAENLRAVLLTKFHNQPQNMYALLTMALRHKLFKDSEAQEILKSLFPREKLNKILDDGNAEAGGPSKRIKK